MSSTRRILNNTLSLKHFQLRAESLKLYRAFCRLTRQRCTSPQQRSELNEYILSEFRSSQHINDIDEIKILLRNGKNQLEHLERQLNLVY